MSSFVGLEKEFVAALENSVLKPFDSLGNQLEGHVSATIRGKMIVVIIQRIVPTIRTLSSDLALIVDPLYGSVGEASENAENVLRLHKYALMSALILRVESVVESIKNHVFPNINWLVLDEISVITGRYNFHRASFRLVPVENEDKGNKIAFIIDIYNVHKASETIRKFSNLSLEITKEDGKITLSLSGTDKYNYLEKSPILGCIRNSISKLLVDKGYIKTAKKFLHEESKDSGNLSIKWTFEAV